MASLTIRNIDDRLKQKLKVRAARNGLSVEEDLRRVLRDLVSEPLPKRRSEAEAKAIFEKLKALAEPPLEPFDQKAVADELYDFLP